VTFSDRVIVDYLIQVDVLEPANLNVVFKLSFILGAKVFSTAQTKLGFLPRIFVAVVLMLALLFGVVNSFSFPKVSLDFKCNW
jgi:hypothetical protein